MLKSQNLIVPLAVHAMCVTPSTPNVHPENETNSFQFIGPAHDFSEFPYRDLTSGSISGQPWLSKSVLNFPLISPREPGVHLHWEFPEGMHRGQISDSGDAVEYPPTPDRWLVTRIHTNKNNVQSSSWVIVSDGVFPDNSDKETTHRSPTFPWIDEKGEQYYMYMGRVLTLAAYLDGKSFTNDSRFKKMTGRALSVAGFGIPTFASYYPECRNVFGFYDDLTTRDHALLNFDAKSSRLFYFVAGFFKDAADDLIRSPFFDLNQGSEKSIQWSFPGMTGGSPDDHPQNTIFCGSLNGIAWDETGKLPGTFPEPAKSTGDVIIGNNATECLAKLLASRAKQADEVELFLNELQYGLLDSLQNPDSLGPAIRRKLHESSFVPDNGGVIWTIRRTSETEGDSLTEGSFDLPADIGEKLNELNLLQKDFDQQNFTLEGLRAALFQEWYKYTLVMAYNGMPTQWVTDLEAFAKTSQKYLKDIARDIEKRVQAIGTYTFDDASGKFQNETIAQTKAGKIVSMVKLLQTSLENISLEYLLSRTAAPRFYTPCDPTVLFTNRDLIPPPRFDADVEHLPCRLSRDVTRLNLHHAEQTSTLLPGDVVATQAIGTLPYADDLQNLLLEHLLLDPNQANHLASTFISKKKITDLAAADLAKLICKLIENFKKPNTIFNQELSLTGVQPFRMSVREFKGNEAHPLILEWRAVYHSIGPTVDERFETTYITDNFKLDSDKIDFLYSSDSTNSTSEYSGFAPLNENSEIRLVAQLEEYNKSNGNAEFEKLLFFIKNLPVQTQVLSGFHNQLIMQTSILQLAPATPGREDAVTKAVAHAIADAYTHSPAIRSNFHPFRGGFVELKEIRITDRFGWRRTIDLPEVAFASANRTSEWNDTSHSVPGAYLPPRIASPARVMFRWLSESSETAEMNLHVATSPICGWITPDPINAALQLHNQQGLNLGMLTTTHDGAGLQWFPAPVNGGHSDPSQGSQDQMQSIERIENEHLKNFVKTIIQKPNAANHFTELYAVLNHAINQILPPGTAYGGDFASLFGRPLAIASATLYLELKGLPPFHQSIESFLKSMQSGEGSDPFNREEFTRIKLPVHLGDVDLSADGLVGFFKNMDFGHFFSDYTQNSTESITRTTDETLLLSASGKPIKLTLILDPYAGIHCYSGIFPSKSISIPSDQFANAIQNIETMFPANHVLQEENKFAVPLPLTPGHKWIYFKCENEFWQENEKLQDCDSNPGRSYSPMKIVEGFMKSRKTNG